VQNNPDLDFLIGTFTRAVILLGFTFFSIYISGISHDYLEVLKGAGLTAGLYFFAELMRYYKIQEPEKKLNFVPLIFV
jgi:hypothetical protein